MIYGTSYLKGAGAPSTNYFGYRDLMMNGFAGLSGNAFGAACSASTGAGDCQSGYVCVKSVGCMPQGNCNSAYYKKGTYCCARDGSNNCYLPPAGTSYTCQATNPTGTCATGYVCYNGACVLQGNCNAAFHKNTSTGMCCRNVSPYDCYNPLAASGANCNSANAPNGVCPTGQVCVAGGNCRIQGNCNSAYYKKGADECCPRSGSGACYDPTPEKCGWGCTSPCATGRPEDCCHWSCPTGVTPPTIQPRTEYPYTGGIVNTTDGSYLPDALTTDEGGPNWLLLGGLGVGAYFLGKWLFAKKGVGAAA